MSELNSNGIVLVDPVEPYRERVAEELRRRGFDVRAMARGEGAREEIGRDPPRLAVVDGILQDGAGIDLVTWIRSTHPSVAVAFTKHKLDEMETHGREATRLGAILVVDKPPTPRALADLLLPHLGIDAGEARAPAPAQIDEALLKLREDYARKVPELFAQIGAALASCAKTDGDPWPALEDAPTSKMIVGRVQDEVRGMAFKGDHGEQFRMTFSAGISVFPEDGADIESIFRDVDAKLYRAKRAGRDTIEI